jgi:hypothetical protein
MGNIERWTVMARHSGEAGGFGWLTIIGGSAIGAERDGKPFEVVPAEQLAGAVDLAREATDLAAEATDVPAGYGRHVAHLRQKLDRLGGQ